MVGERDGGGDGNVRHSSVLSPSNRHLMRSVCHHRTVPHGEEYDELSSESEAQQIN